MTLPNATLNASRFTRRRFLRAGVLTVGALAVPGTLLAKPHPLTMPKPSSRDLQYADFADQVLTEFRVTDAPGGPLALQLIEATLRPPSPHEDAAPTATAYERFSLIFSGAAERLLAQRIYQFEHPVIGRAEMFIVPVLSPTPGPVQYQAVFNRPADGPAQTAA